MSERRIDALWLGWRTGPRRRLSQDSLGMISFADTFSASHFVCGRIALWTSLKHLMKAFRAKFSLPGTICVPKGELGTSIFTEDTEQGGFGWGSV